ncbi:flippase [Streptomyces sp. NPDC047880]|uniref:flippase n=1 Tax=Streptomyces sp. NPDC047880 TaxID=3155626 RepID=UPI00345128C2
MDQPFRDMAGVLHIEQLARAPNGSRVGGGAVVKTRHRPVRSRFGRLHKPNGTAAEPGDRAEPTSGTVRTARTIVVLGVTEVIGKLSMVLVVIGAARLLGVADFGVFAYALAVGALATTVPLWGYDTIVVQRASAAPERLRALLAELLVMRTGLVALVFAIICGALVLSRPSDSDTALAGLIVVAAVLLDTFTEAYRSAAAAQQRQNTIAVVHLMQRLLTAAWVLTALLLDTGLMGLAVAYFAGTAVGPVAAMLLIRRQGTRADWSAVSVGSLVRLNRGTWMIGLESIVAMALFRLDTLFLGWLAGNRVVGLYAAPYRLLETAVFVCWVVSRAVFPLMASDPRPHRVRRHTERGIGVLAAVFIPYMTVLLCRGHDVLLLLYGEQFADAGTDTLRWLAPAPLLFGIAYLLSDALTAAGPTLRALTGAVTALVVNVVLNLALIPHYGGVAAAFTTSCSYAVAAVVLILLGPARIGRPRLTRTVLPAVVASGLAAGPLLAPWPLAPALLAAAVVYVSCWAAIARRLDPEQIQVLRQMFRRRSVQKAQ